MNHTSRFSGKANDYSKFRPKYPKGFEDLLLNKIHLSSDKTVADIGSGTGISSEFLVKNGNTVFGVEPNAEMRKIAEQTFSKHKNFVSKDATAEKTTLDDESIDLIFAGTAFHWFDAKKTKVEFDRILKKQGNIVIAWISRDLQDQMQREIENVYDKFQPEIVEVENQKNEKQIAEFFFPKSVNYECFPEIYRLNQEQFLGRLSSSSYYLPQTDKNYSAMNDDMISIFDKFENGGMVKFKYNTEVYWV